MPRNLTLRGSNRLFLNDILKVIYEPHKVFKSIVTNPKYLGALVVLVLFIGLQVGYDIHSFLKLTLNKPRLQLTSWALSRTRQLGEAAQTLH